MRTMIRTALRGLLALALAVLMSSAVASAAADGGDAPALHIGVRAVVVGEPLPVTIVGAEPGSTWEIRERRTDTALGVLTVSSDGTGTTTMSLPLDTDPGSAELVAVNGSVELGAAASVGSAHENGEPPAEPAESAGSGERFPIAPVAVAAAIGLAAVSTVLFLRIRRGTAAERSMEDA